MRIARRALLGFVAIGSLALATPSVSPAQAPEGGTSNTVHQLIVPK